MKKRLLAFLAAVLLALVVVTPHAGIADLGDFSGGSDFGGSDWGGSDWGGSDWGSSSDWGGSSYVSSRGSGSFDGGDIIFIIILIAVIVIVASIRAKNKKNTTTRAPGAIRTAASILRPISEIKSRDPNFSEEDFKEWLQNLYIKMQDCCAKRDVEPIRPYFADSIYQQFNRQMQQLKAQHRTNHVERIAVLSVTLRGCYQDKGEDVIVAEVYTRIVDYTTDDNTGEVVAGSKTDEKFMTYEYSLSRPIGMQTEKRAEGVTQRHCPNCGAPLSVNESIKCPYCDSVLTFSDHDWTVYAIKGISQRTK